MQLFRNRPSHKTILSYMLAIQRKKEFDFAPI